MENVRNLLKKIRNHNIDIHLSGDNLKINYDSEELPEDLFNEIKSNKNLIISFLRQIDNRKNSISINTAEDRTSYELSSSQRRLWILSQFDGGNKAYNMPGVYVFDGKLDINSLELAFKGLISRHEILRTIFKEEGEEVKQWIHPISSIEFTLGYEDLRNLSDREDLARIKIQEEIEWPFNLSEGPLLRAGLLHLEEEKYVFTYVMHHIISDGWSMGILIKELFEMYNSLIKGVPINLEPLRIQYKDYAAWQQEQLRGENLEIHRKYWLTQFSGELPVVDISSTKQRPAIKSFNGSAIYRLFEGALASKLGAFCQVEGGTLFMGVLTAVNTLLYKYTNQTDIILGSDVAGRNHSDLENQIGFYVNTLALRTQFSGSDNFLDLFRKVKIHTLEAVEHQMYPFDTLVEDLQLKRDLSRNPLFDVLVTLQDTEINDNRKDSLKLEDISISEFSGTEHVVSIFDISFNFNVFNEELSCSIEYNTEIYDSENIENMLTHLGSILSIVIENPEIPVNEIDFISLQEKDTLNKFNDVSPYFPLDQNIIELIECQVKLHGEKTAIYHNDQSITYSELWRNTNRFARHLHKNYDIKSDCLFGIMMDRSIIMMETILSVWKSGGAYIPIDVDYPEDRIKQIIETSNLTALIVNDLLAYDYINTLNLGIPIISTENISSVLSSESDLAFNVKTNLSDLAYVIFTSGSTGKPKGVMIEHLGMINHIGSKITELGIDSHSKIAQNAAHTFDISVWQFFSSLVAGASTTIYSHNVIMDPEEFVKKLNEDAITVLELVPSYLIEMLEVLEDKSDIYTLAKLKILVLNAETLMPSMVKRWLTIYPEIPIVNTYGITEVSDDISHYIMYDCPKTNTVPVLKKPIQNFEVHIVNEKFKLQPIGVTGEILLSGPCIGRGYLNDLERTEKVFLQGPILGVTNHNRIYRTGDIGRYHPDGTMEFLGRKDTQVKIKGNRIELGEIEHVLMENEFISNVKVIANIDKQYLVVYYVSEIELSTDDILDSMKQKLPHYMMPQYIIPLDKFPLNANGKIDVKLLPEPKELLLIDINHVSPRNATESKLVDIWGEILGIEKEKIGVKNNFFELGGHSLKAIRLISKFHKELGVKLELKDIFKNITIEQQAELVDEANSTLYQSILPINPKPNYSLSSSQRRLWILSQFDGGNKAYNMPGVYVFDGKLDINSLELAFKGLISRHEILRTIFKEEGEEVKQWIHPISSIEFTLGYEDLRNLSDREDLARIKIQEEIEWPFNLSEGPLLRAGLLHIEEEKYVFTYLMHHIISDGWSMGILIKELFEMYNSLIKGVPINLEPLRIQYKDYAAWQQEQLSGEKLELHKQYWLTQFSGELPVLELSTDKPRPVVKTYNGSVVTGELNAQTSLGLLNLLKENGSTLFMGLVGVINTLLYKYTNQEDIIIGSPIAGREHSDLEEQIGFYVNTLALRTKFKKEESYRQLLKTIKANTLEAYQHQMYPFDELVGELNLARDVSRSALFDVMIVLQNNAVAENEHLGDIKISSFNESNHVNSKFDLTFNFAESENTINVLIEFNTDLFDRRTIEIMIIHLENLINSIISFPELSINELQCIDEDEKKTILDYFNATESNYPREITIVKLFEAQVLKTPDNLAIIFEDEKLTYKELNLKSNKLANYLRKKFSIKPDEFVGVKLNRSIEMLVSILGILKSGGAYVPIDPEYPQERVDYIINDSQCKVVIDEKEYSKLEADSNSYGIENPGSVNSSKDLAYIIYTSGTTGQPKGVMIEHKSLVNLCFWHRDEFLLTEKDRATLYAGVAFDASVWEIFPYLNVGSCLYVVPEKIRFEVEALNRFFESNEISVAFLPTQMAEYFIEVENTSLRFLLTGGDKLRGYKKTRYNFINNYGPTENTVVTTSFQIEANSNNISIGRPIGNTQVYILNDCHQLQPLGVVGEICIGGDGLARGYLNKPELTSEKFVNNPFKEGSRMYKTGDLGRWLSDGNIEFVGRKDDQVKIRGYRIELGEIESVLSRYELIEDVVVLAQLSGSSKELVAYLVSKEELQLSDLRSYLGKSLPSYMIPTYFVQLEKLPLTPNGKVDKKALPLVSSIGVSKAVEYVSPRNATESKLVDIWGEILGIEEDHIGVNDDFFELGGNSIKAIKLRTLINIRTNLDVSLKDIYNKSTILNLCQLNSLNTNILTLSKNLTSNNSSLYFIPPVLGNSAFFTPLVENLEGLFNCYGFQFPGLEEKESFPESIVEMAEIFSKELMNKHSVNNKIILFGYSMGVIVSFEMTKILEQRGYQVLLVIADKAVQVKSINTNYDEHYIDELVEKYNSLILEDYFSIKHIKSFLANNIQISNNYTQSGIVKANILAFEAKDNDYSSEMDNWKKFTTGRYKMKVIDGDHWELFSESNFPVIIDFLVKYN